MSLELTVLEIFLIALFALTLFHARRFNLKRLLLPLALFAVIAAIQENLVISLTGNYVYGPFNLWVGQLPLSIILAWIVIAYLGFLVARKTRTALGALAASSIDLAMEPLAYFTGAWTWIPTVPTPITYFNAPVSNALGWFLLTLLGVWLLRRWTVTPEPQSAKGLSKKERKLLANLATDERPVEESWTRDTLQYISQELDKPTSQRNTEEIKKRIATLQEKYGDE